MSASFEPADPKPVSEATPPSDRGEEAPARLIDVVLQQPVAGSERRVEQDSALPFESGQATLEDCLRVYRTACGVNAQSRQEIVALFDRTIAEIDRLGSELLDKILHHPKFQALESSWRGLEYLLDAKDGDPLVKLRILDLRKKELQDDLEQASEFDQSELFKKVYGEEFDRPGGEPYGLLIGNYEFDTSFGDVHLLKAISGVAAAAFSPFVAGAAPKMFGLNSFRQLERVDSFEQHFSSKKMIKWNALRDAEDSRYVGLTLPRTLMRLPYGHNALRSDGFLYSEDTSQEDLSGYLWGNAAFAFGAVVINAFVNTSWFADIRGTNRGPHWGGVASGLPAQSFETDRRGVAVKCSLDTSVNEDLEKHLSDLGFISLCDCPDTEFAAFYANHSIQKPKQYHDYIASTNARMSSMIQYMLCASRFAHYLKSIARDKIGTFTDAAELEATLHGWVHEYVSQDPSIDHKTRARFPLRGAKVEVESRVSDPGHLFASMHLWPQYQLDEMTASIKLESRLKKS